MFFVPFSPREKVARQRRLARERRMRAQGRKPLSPAKVIG